MSRPSARERGYTSAWDKARAGFLRSHPSCVACSSEGRHTPACHVHHSTPHRGDMRVFWDQARWVPLCQEHHNRDAQQIETRGYSDRVGRDGMPSDPKHPFNRGGAGGVESRRTDPLGPLPEVPRELVALDRMVPRWA